GLWLIHMFRLWVNVLRFSPFFAIFTKYKKFLSLQIAVLFLAKCLNLSIFLVWIAALCKIKSDCLELWGISGYDLPDYIVPIWSILPFLLQTVNQFFFDNLPVDFKYVDATSSHKIPNY
ncbi:MAG: hypothetical protein LUD76_01725, partial [Alistipes sp.]|nr:hypothetical protein [Alistipes sp.]